jgi:hypothetical protein
MSLWGKSDSSNAAPKFAGVDIGIAGSANGSTLFGNTQIAAFQTNHNIAVGVFGVDTTEQTVSSSSNTHSAHAGWVLVKQGTGPVVTISANTGAYSPDGNIYLTFTGGGTGTTTANAQIVTDGKKMITGITVNSGGNYLRAPVATATNANATYTITMGGRAGRRQTETLVAMGTIGAGAVVADAADDATYADS